MTSSRNLLPRLKLLSAFLLLFLVNGKIALAQPAATVTTLAVTAAGSPVTSIPTSTAVTLTATVISAGTPVTPGQVYFCNAIEPACNYTNNLATAQLTSAGTASYKFIPGPGSQSYIAVFAGTTANTTSTSSASATLTVTGKAHTSAAIISTGTVSDYTLQATVFGSASAAPSGNVSVVNSTTPPITTYATTPLVANPPSFELNPLSASSIYVADEGPFTASANVIADFNGDGIPDSFSIQSAYTNDSSGTCVTQVGTQDGPMAEGSNVYGVFIPGVGDGTFNGQAISQFAIPCPSTNAVAADVNGDGFLDIIIDGTFITNIPNDDGVTSDTITNGVYVLLNDGTGHFTVVGGSNTYSFSPGSMAVADFNRDGYPDVAINTGANIQIGLGNSTGNFTFPAPDAPSSGSIASFAAGDFNNDGIPDIVELDSSLSIYLGTGTGAFTAAPYSNTGLAYGNYITAADLNNDGNLDIAFNNASISVSGLNVLWGNGTGSFPTSTQLPFASTQVVGGPIAAADFNNDGKLDLLASGGNNPGPYSIFTYFQGSGSGTFQTSTLTFPGLTLSSQPLPLLISDVNGDGVLDVAAEGDILLGSTQSSTGTVNDFTLPPATGYVYLYPSYDGDTNYLANTPSTLSSVTLQSATGTPTVTLTGPPNPGQINTSLAFTVSATGVGGATIGGTVYFFSNGSYIGATGLNNGVGTFHYTFVSDGTYSITAVYQANSTYNQASSQPVSVTIVGGLTSTVAVSSSTASTNYGLPLTLTAKVTGSSGTPTGTVTFMSPYTSAGPVTLDSTGTATYTFGSSTYYLEAGRTYNFTAQYSGNNTYASGTSSSSAPVVINPTTPLIVASATTAPGSPGQKLTTETATFSMPPGVGNVYPSGTVNFVVNGKSSGGNSVGNLVATTTVALAPGTYQLAAEYIGDSNFNRTNSPAATITVPKYTSSINTSEFSRVTTYGTSASLIVTISGGSAGVFPTGTVTYSLGSTVLGTTTVMSNTQAALTVPAGKLAGGTSTISVSYSGDSNFAASTGIGTVTLTKAQPTIALTSSASTASSGSAITFTAKLAYTGAAPTGTVTLYDGSTALTSLTPTGGVVTYTDSSLSAGTHSITAGYSGDTDYSSITSSPITVFIKRTASILTSELSKPYTYGSPASLVVTVAGGSGGVFPTGTVTFSNGATTLGTTTVMSNTQAALTVPAGKLPGGTSTITISYSGDSNFTSATATPTVTVSQVQPTIALTSSASTAFGGTPITFTAKLTYTGSGAAPTGQITLYDGATAITSLTPTNGVITYTDSTLSAGANSITAGYAGDTNYAAATSSPVSVTINKGTVTLDTAEMTHSTFTYKTNPSTTPFTVSVYGSTHDVFPTGTLTFSTATGLVLGQSQVSNNAPSSVYISDQLLALGYNTINVSYSGDNNYPSATTTVVVLLQTQPNTNLRLSGSGYLYTYATPITMTATITSTDAIPLTGLITFYDGATALSSTAIPSGNSTTTYTATYTNSTLAAGNHSLSFTYTNDPRNLSANSGVIPIDIKKTTDSIVTSEFSNAFTYGSPTPLVVTIAGGSGGVFPTGTVTFSYRGNGTRSSTTPVMANTQAAVTLPAYTLFAGTTQITVSYSGDSNFAPVTVVAPVTLAKEPTSVTLTSSTTTATVGSPITFTAITGPIYSGLNGSVSLYDGATAIASFGGAPSLTYSGLAVGTHTLTAVYTALTGPGYGNYLNSTSAPITVTITAPPASNTSKK